MILKLKPTDSNKTISINKKNFEVKPLLFRHLVFIPTNDTIKEKEKK